MQNQPTLSDIKIATKFIFAQMLPPAYLIMAWKKQIMNLIHQEISADQVDYTITRGTSLGKSSNENTELSPEIGALILLFRNLAVENI